MKRWLPLLALWACTPSFQDQSVVRDLRVLAVKAEPPEAQYDDQGVDDVQVRVLVLAPSHPPGPQSMVVTLCGPTDSRRCDTGPSFSLGQQPLSTTLVVPSAALEAAVANDDLGGFGGLRVQFSLSIDDGDPARAVFASKVLLYSKRGSNPTPNHNPLLTGMHLTNEGVDGGTLQPGEMLHLPIGVKIGLRPLLADGARETYQTTDLRGNVVQLTEQPQYSFFTKPGAEFDNESADEPLDGVAPPDGLTRIDSLVPGSGTMWIVVRDGRGGESWISFPWTTD